MASDGLYLQPRGDDLIVGGRDKEVAAWMCQHLPLLELTTPYTAIGVTDSRGRLTGGVLYDNFVKFNIQTHIVLMPGAMTPLFLGEVFRYPFEQLACRRITAMVSDRNQRSKRLCKRLGFKLEGICREAYPDGSDLYVFGMLKGECRWLNLRRPHEQRLRATGS